MTDEQKIRRISDCIRDSRYLDNDRTWRISRLTDMMYDAYSRKGQGASNAETLAEALDREIADYMGYQLSFSEACLAIDWGLHGEYGEFTGLNVERLYRFVRSYLESEVRQQAVGQTKSRQQGPAEMSQDEKQERNWYAMLNQVSACWREFRTLGDLDCLQARGGSENDEGARIAGRVCCLSAYQWLKCVGLVARDADTSRTEAEMERNALRRLRKTGTGFEVKAYAGALMLRETFRTAQSAGVDMKTELDRIYRETPLEERRFWT